MSLLFIQGFEQFKPTSVAEDHVLATEMRDYLGFVLPTNRTNWFLDSSGGISNDSGPLVISSDYRINGQSLIIKRPDSGATYNSSYNGTQSMDLSYSFDAQRAATVGFGLKLSKAPSVPVPLVQFWVDDGVTAGELCSLWLGPKGQFFFSSVDFDIEDTSIITPASIAETLSAEQAFNFDVWNYIEVTANYNTTPGTLSVAVNNIPVIDAAQPNNANKDGRITITKVSIINAPNSYYPDDSYNMTLDDVYFLDAQSGSTITAPVGPQHIILLDPTSTTQDEFTITGGGTAHGTVAGVFDKSDVSDYLTNATASDENIYGLEDAPGSVVQVTAVQVSGFMSVDAGSVSLDFKLTYGGDTATREVSVVETSATLKHRMFSTDPAGDAWTLAALNGSTLGLEVV